MTEFVLTDPPDIGQEINKGGTCINCAQEIIN